MRIFCKKDLAVILLVVLAAAVSGLAVSYCQKSEGDTIRITIDGVLYGEYSLSGEQSIFIDSASGYNRLVIENGSVYMAEADCPDKYCMDYKPVSRGGETIICLPHRLVVEVTGTRDAHQPDVVVQ